MNRYFKSKVFSVAIVTIMLITLAQIFAKIPSNVNYQSKPIDLQGDTLKSLEAFNTVLRVLKHPRCINCHPTGDRPRQGDDQHIHLFNVQRGPDNHGGLVQKCQTCHHDENNSYTNVPGAPHWGLAPKSMGWFGLSDEEIAHRFISKETNGGRSPEDLVHHMKHDALVLWGWNPGEGRTAVDVPFEEFTKALDTWLEHGAYVPTK